MSTTVNRAQRPKRKVSSVAPFARFAQAIGDRTDAPSRRVDDIAVARREIALMRAPDELPAR
jgi:hypothetical protein